MIINAANAIIAYQIPKQSSIIIEGGNSVGERLSYYSEVPAIIQDSGSNAVRQTIHEVRHPAFKVCQRAYIRNRKVQITTDRIGNI